MARANISTLAKKEGKVGDRLPYLSHAGDVTIALRDGMLMQVILLDGFPFETADTEELNYRLTVRDTMLRSVGNARIALYHHIVRRRTTADLKGSFEDPFSRWLDQRWRRRIGEKRLYVNDLFLTLVYRPSIGKVGLLDRIGDRARRDRGAGRERDIRTLDGVRESLIASLKPYGPRTLGRYVGAGGVCSEPLEFLSLLLNGELNPVVEPQGIAAHHLPYKRLSFGIEAMELKGAGEREFGAMLSMKEYPNTTTPGMLDGLLRLPIDMIVTESFSFVDRQIAQERIDLSLRRLRAADDDTVTLKRGLMAAKDDAASGGAAFGEHHLSVMVRADSLPALDTAAASVQAAVADIGAIAVREQLGLEPAFWAQFPGNFDFIARRALISSGNAAGLCSLHGFPIGSAEGNHWGSAITVFETTSATPYYFNFHQGDLGNFLVIGPSGSGKTVVLNFLTAQAQKIAPRTVFFDKDRGAEIFLRAIGGVYETLRHGKPTGFNPLQLADSGGTRAFLRALIAQLARRPAEPLSSEELAVIAEAVDANFDQPIELRRLRYFRELLGGVRRPEAGDIAQRIARWCAGGEFAWLFDNAQDRLSVDARVLGFDMTELLDAPELRTPAMMYLFRRIEERLDGSPTLIVIDEGWKALDDEVFGARLKDWLKTIRKRNGVVGFCTQSARDALDSRIASAIREQTAAQIFMPNPRANEDDYGVGFGLTAHELDIVRSLPEESRCFLIKAGTDSVVARLDLSGEPEAMRVLSGREKTVRALDDLRARVGDAPSNWLPILLGDARAPKRSKEARRVQKRTSGDAA
ncbi:MAG: VirB4 family type IV secretion/conjugal transfer ATPase [Parvularculaceae bacterium]|nr:VirB4 family type IV secretion/conjugal transfer ATPase [Parvularculaceae bacterium]